MAPPTALLVRYAPPVLCCGEGPGMWSSGFGVCTDGTFKTGAVASKVATCPQSTFPSPYFHIQPNVSKPVKKLHPYMIFNHKQT